MAKRNKNNSEVSFAFFEYLQVFLRNEHKRVYSVFTPLTRKYLNFNNPKVNARAFLRQPQFEALEVYAFLKEFCENQKLWQIFEEWFNRTGKFEGRQIAGVASDQQTELFDVTEVNQELTKKIFEQVFAQIKQMEQDYPNYIFALTMGLGKTVLMATCIFYEFLLAHKYPKNPLYCHNVLVFAPDITVLQSLREIQTFDKSKVIPSEYLSHIDANIKFHFLDEAGGTLNVIDNSDYNVIISNTQKIILKKSHTAQTPVQTLFGSLTSKYTPSSVMGTMAELAGDVGLDSAEAIETELDLMSNQRFLKLLRLRNLGIFVDEAHHVFGDKLSEDLMTTKKTKSLRLTINELAASLKKAGSQVVACYNFTGTPYVKNRLLPEVVYSYGLKKAIDAKYLKRADIYQVSNVRKDTLAFVRTAIEGFWNKYGNGQRFENMLPKMAFFASTVEELQNELRPAVETVLSELNIDTNKILVNVGDSTITSNDDLREFKVLDTPSSEKQFILLVNKGKEGWNCRSLFAVALHREPKSRIFVLQATMRCLRQISDVQQVGLVYLSEECYHILDEELKENLNMSIEQFKNSGDKSPHVEVRIIPPVVTIKLKKIKKLFHCTERILKDKIDFEIDDIKVEDYLITVTKRAIDDLDRKISIADQTSAKTNREFTAYTLVAEISKYLNMSPIRIKRLLETSVDGVDAIIEKVNFANEILYDKIIPILFKSLFDVKEFTSEEEIELALIKEPKDGSDCYMVSYKDDLLVSAENYPEYKDKTFNLDNYSFDSRPEKELFFTLLRDKQIKKVWFTGMFTHGQTDFYINYIDPKSGGVRSYYPDFLVQNDDDTYTIVEVKGDNKIDDEIVLAKQNYAQQIAHASGMEYIILKGSDCLQGKGIHNNNSFVVDFERKAPVNEYDPDKTYDISFRISADPGN